MYAHNVLRFEKSIGRCKGLRRKLERTRNVSHACSFICTACVWIRDDKGVDTSKGIAKGHSVKHAHQTFAVLVEHELKQVKDLDHGRDFARVALITPKLHLPRQGSNTVCSHAVVANSPLAPNFQD